MIFDWQTGIALACVAAAAWAVMLRIRSGWIALNQPDGKGSGCGGGCGSGCGGGCPACPSASERQPLIEVTSIKKLARRTSSD